MKMQRFCGFLSSLRELGTSSPVLVVYLGFCCVLSVFRVVLVYLGVILILLEGYQAFKFSALD